MNPASPAESALKHAGFGIASLLLGVVNLLGAALCVLLFVVIIGAFFYPLVIISAVLGALLGLIGLLWPRQPRRRGLAIAGVVLNVLALVPFYFIMSTHLLDTP
ncbi:MAG: hypothetical protein IT472_01055 [Thermomonas sp.]|uniref:hypothetical protein n=1 Tax=Thermomonas sp. TaxID=1971895 RepID=UPI00261EA87D|nr:hypothetical protein [Thermomonas sp.]MCC7095757.1 hypothetical protein [Thermomonas sp.]